MKYIDSLIKLGFFSITSITLSSYATYDNKYEIFKPNAIRNIDLYLQFISDKKNP